MTRLRAPNRGRRRPTWSELVDQRAECTACTFTATGPGALGNAAQHYDKTRHPITTTVTRTVTYGAEADHAAALVAAGQLALGDPA